MCFKNSPYKEVKFKEQWLKVDTAVDPELLHWKNFGVSRKSKFFRQLIFLLSLISLFAICFYTVFYFENLIYDAEKRLPPFDCTTSIYQNVNENEALADYKLSWDKRNGNWMCYCQNKQEQLSQSDFKNITFYDVNPSPEDAEYCDKNNNCFYCNSWDSR